MSTLTLPAGRFFGKTLAARQIAGFQLTESAYGSGATLPRHSHERAHYCYVLAGAYTERVGRRAVARATGGLSYYPPDLCHAEQHDQPGRHFLIEIDPAHLTLLEGTGQIPREPVDLSRASAFEAAMRLYREFAAFDSVSALAIEGLALELLAHTCRASVRNSRPRPRWLEHAREVLHARYAESLTLAEIARVVGVHPVHLAQVFRRVYGCTCGDYLRKLRIEFACRKLATSSEPLAQIALAAGFADQSHLTRVFLRMVGVTPAVYRGLFRRAP